MGLYSPDLGMSVMELIFNMDGKIPWSNDILNRYFVLLPKQYKINMCDYDP